jgi:pimeloyl-ACP methyl ester carboxylesterase
MMLLLFLAVATVTPARGDSDTIRRVPVGHNEVLRTAIVGTGPTVVVVPGLLGGGYGFRALIPRLVDQGFRVALIEPLGMGGSSRPPGADYSLTAQTTRLARALDILGISHAIIVGHSIGAALALRLACRRPDLARAAIAIDGGESEGAATPGLRRLVGLGPLARLLMSPGGVRHRIRQGLSENSADPRWITDAVVEGYSADLIADPQAALDAFYGMVNSTEPRSTEDDLSGCKLPMLLLVGKVPHPNGIRPEGIERLKRLIPNLGVETVPGAGQYIHEEQPEVVLQAVTGVDIATRTP